MLDPYLKQTLIFLLILTRVSGLVFVMPVLGSKSLPPQARALLAVAIAAMLTPLYWELPFEPPTNLVLLTLLLVREAVIGLSLGLAVLILFSGMQLAGHIIGQMSGLQLADVFDPTFDQTVPIFAQLLEVVTLMVFVIIGGHRQLLGALLDTFHWMPPGQGSFPISIVDTLNVVVTHSFAAGIRASAPAMVALLLAAIVTGLISRTLPQLNLLSVGFNINAFVMFATVWISLATAVWVFQESIGDVIDAIRGAMQGEL